MKEAVAVGSFDVLAESIGRLERETAARERSSAVGRLAGVIAREIRHPLLAIRGSLRALRAEGVRPEDVRAAAVDIDREVARLDRVVRAALDFTRPVRVDLAPVDLAALVWDAAGSILGGWEGPHVRLALDPGLGTAVTDAGRLRGVLHDPEDGDGPRPCDRPQGGGGARGRDPDGEPGGEGTRVEIDLPANAALTPAA